MDKPSLRATSRILLFDGGSLDKVRTWDGQGEWENRVSSLTAENIAWLDSQSPSLSDPICDCYRYSVGLLTRCAGIGVWQYIKEHRSCPVHEMIIWANPDADSTPGIHFPPLDHPMARMTENMNLQQALYKRIDAVGKGIVDIKESSRVAEMREGPDGRWVGLRIGDDKWVRGSLVVSLSILRFTCSSPCPAARSSVTVTARYHARTA